MTRTTRTFNYRRMFKKWLNYRKSKVKKHKVGKTLRVNTLSIDTNFQSQQLLSRRYKESCSMMVIEVLDITLSN